MKDLMQKYDFEPVSQQWRMDGYLLVRKKAEQRDDNIFIDLLFECEINKEKYPFTCTGNAAKELNERYPLGKKDAGLVFDTPVKVSIWFRLRSKVVAKKLIIDKPLVVEFEFKTATN